jgi:hypothetical protein
MTTRWRELRSHGPSSISQRSIVVVLRVLHRLRSRPRRPRRLRVLLVLLLIGSVRKHALSGTSWAWGASPVASPGRLRHEGLDGALVPAAQRFQLEWAPVGGRGSDEGRMAVNEHRKFSQIGCGSRRGTSTRVWGATQGLRSTNWATSSGRGGRVLHLPACWVVTSHFPPAAGCPFSGSQRGKSHPSYHQTLKAHICSPLPHSPVRPFGPFDPFDPFTYRIRGVVVISGQTHSPSDILHHLARAQLATVACLLPPRKSECRVIYHGAQASTQIEQPGRGIRFPNTTVADRTVAAPGTWRCIPVWTVHAALGG